MKLEMTNFTNLNEAECRMVLEWRNHPNIRNYMSNKNIITKEEHLNFIKRLEQDNKKKYFLIKEGDEYLGVIDFIDIERGSCEFGLYATPYNHKKGVGSLLLEEIIRYAFDELKVKKIRAKLYKENKKALGLYEKYGLKTTCEDEEYFYMELKKQTI